jgi:hypothetical protein
MRKIESHVKTLSAFFYVFLYSFVTVHTLKLADQPSKEYVSEMLLTACKAYTAWRSRRPNSIYISELISSRKKPECIFLVCFTFTIIKSKTLGPRFHRFVPHLHVTSHANGLLTFPYPNSIQNNKVCTKNREEETRIQKYQCRTDWIML